MEQKNIKLAYWIATILLSIGMLSSGILEVMQTPQAKESMKHLGYPIYLNYIIGIAKILGVIILLQPKFKIIKEWAYAGFTIDFIGASASLFFTGNGILMSLSPIPFIVISFISYYLWKKIEMNREV